MIGVTGSDGKTTTTHLIYHILNKLGYKVAMISTVAAFIQDEQLNTGFHVTSPDPFLLQKLLRQISDRGFTHVVLEATSHGLDQFRLLGCNFKVAVLTNITHEHLDYHESYSAYLAAKARLFKSVKYAILNRDDKSFPLIKAFIHHSVKIVSYGLSGKTTLSASNVHETTSGSLLTVKWGKQQHEARLPLSGRYNIQNALAAIGVALCLGEKLNDITTRLEDFPPVKGRLNQVYKSPSIYVDFAHTPNALEQVLILLKGKLKETNKLTARLIVVFGCAGERDWQKRPMMGKIAGRLADISIITTEDPRSENTNDIIDQITVGIKKSGAKEVLDPGKKIPSRSFVREPDRQLAINLAVRTASPEDIIVVTGKGHEESMNLGRGEIPWSDFDAIKRALEINPQL